MLVIPIVPVSGVFPGRWSVYFHAFGEKHRLVVYEADLEESGRFLKVLLVCMRDKKALVHLPAPTFKGESCVWVPMELVIQVPVGGPEGGYSDEEDGIAIN